MTKIQNYDCADCGIDTSELGEYYMVNNELWISAIAPTQYETAMMLRRAIDLLKHTDPAWKLVVMAYQQLTDGMLCVGCLEYRIDRRLQPGDFTDAPVNSPLLYEKSTRILERMGL
jgi:hypothetical protein